MSTFGHFPGADIANERNIESEAKRSMRIAVVFPDVLLDEIPLSGLGCL